MSELSERQKLVYRMIDDSASQGVTVNVAYLSQKLMVSRRTILRDLSVLTSKSMIRRVGSDKKGYWVVMK